MDKKIWIGIVEHSHIENPDNPCNCCEHTDKQPFNHRYATNVKYEELSPEEQAYHKREKLVGRYTTSDLIDFFVKDLPNNSKIKLTVEVENEYEEVKSIFGFAECVIYGIVVFIFLFTALALGN